MTPGPKALVGPPMKSRGSQVLGHRSRQLVEDIKPPDCGHTRAATTTSCPGSSAPTACDQLLEQRARLLDFVSNGNEAGGSFRELAELTGRTQTPIRRALDEAQVPRRPQGTYFDRGETKGKSSRSGY